MEDGVKFAALGGLKTHDKEKIAIAHQPMQQIDELLAVCRDVRKLPED